MGGSHTAISIKVLLAVALSLLFAYPAHATAPITPTQAPLTNEQLAQAIAHEYGLNEALFVKVVKCESHFDENAIGDHGTSFGIAQLHNPYSDWGIATTVALDPVASLHIMAKAWVRGEQGRWSCYKLSTGQH